MIKASCWLVSKPWKERRTRYWWWLVMCTTVIYPSYLHWQVHMESGHICNQMCERMECSWRNRVFTEMHIFALNYLCQIIKMPVTQQWSPSGYVNQESLKPTWSLRLFGIKMESCRGHMYCITSEKLCVHISGSAIKSFCDVILGGGGKAFNFSGS